MNDNDRKLNIIIGDVNEKFVTEAFEYKKDKRSVNNKIIKFLKERKRIAVASVAILLCVALFFTSARPPLIVNANEFSKGYSRKIKGKVNISPEFYNSMYDFSFELFKNSVFVSYDEGEVNYAVSPLSAALCLALLANGAKGDTLAEIESVFGMKLDEINESLYGYVDSLYTSRHCKINIANSIWFRDDEERLRINEGFLQTNADWYDAQVYGAPFDETTLRDINNWCEYYTDGMIDKILEEIPRSAVMYLINSLAFDAKWENSKWDEYEEGRFHNYDGTDTSVMMMKRKAEVCYLESDDFYGFAIDYKGGRYSFVALLPCNSDIYWAIDDLDSDNWRKLWNNREENTELEITMPEFSYTSENELNETLKNMGVNGIFNPAEADLSGVGTSSFGNIYCDFVKQDVMIDVNRNGTKAAAVTIVEIENSSCRSRINFNRPFLYGIVDNDTGVPLFLGAVTDMSELN